MSNLAMPGDYSRARDAQRAARNVLEKRGSFDVVAGDDPVIIEGDPAWSDATKEMWLVATRSEVARHRWTSTDLVMFKDCLAWFDSLPVHKRGAHAYAVRNQVLAQLGLTDAGRRALGLVVEPQGGRSDVDQGVLADALAEFDALEAAGDELDE